MNYTEQRILTAKDVLGIYYIACQADMQRRPSIGELCQAVSGTDLNLTGVKI